MSVDGLEERKVDHLILLVGGNPLPNAVAGRLLVKAEGRITLVHSAETVDIATRLRTWLLNKQTIINHVDLQQVAPTNADDIYNKVNRLVKAGERTGLNYTGGTKAMAVHAHRAVRPKIDLANLSYLDPRTLYMKFDGKLGPDDELAYYVGNMSQVRFELEHDLMALHKNVTIDPTRKPETYAMLPKTTLALAGLWGKHHKQKDWFNWLGKLKRYKLGKSFYDRTRGRWCNWIREEKLRKVTLPFPPHIGTTMREELTGLGYPSTHKQLIIGEAYDVLTTGKTDPYPEDLCDWLTGHWFEHYTFACLDKLRTQFKFHTILLNVDTQPPNSNQPEGFEMDVVAIRGYQLFAFSCSTSGHPQKLKPKLFQAFVRARQLGGDEARIALVTTTREQNKLEDEMKSTIDPRIKVFGIQHLATLQQDLADWIATQI